MEQILYRYNPWWEKEFKIEKFFARPEVFKNLADNLSGRQVVILTGLRRVGKTTLMKQMVDYLINEKKVDPRLIFYASLDDYLLADKNLLEIIEAYRKIHKLSFSKKVFLFLDEITYQKNFAIQLKNIYDQQNAKLYVSSSSASKRNGIRLW